MDWNAFTVSASSGAGGPRTRSPRTRTCRPALDLSWRRSDSADARRSRPLGARPGGEGQPCAGAGRLAAHRARRSPRSETAVAFVDATIVNIAFPNIERSFPGTSISTLSWVLNAYNIVFAAFLVAAGGSPTCSGAGGCSSSASSCSRSPRCCARWRRRPARSIAFRVVQALGAACLVPASLALVLNAFPPDRRAHGVALLVGGGAAAAGLGPSLGGPARAHRQLAAGVPGQHADRDRGGRARSRRTLVESRTPGRRRMPDLVGAAAHSRSRSRRSCSASSRARTGAGRALRIIASFAVAAVARRRVRLALHVAPIADRRPRRCSGSARSAWRTR